MAPDGSPVALYRRLPAGDDLDVLVAALPAGADVLDLGCGAGRLAHPLRERGHDVWAVDQSPAMLDEVSGCTTVLADIQSLGLGRAFAAVLLAGNLVNTDDPRRRQAFLATCRRHVAPDGAVLLQRLDPLWAATAQSFTSRRNGVRFSLEVDDASPAALSGRVDYQFGDIRCAHRFRMLVLDDSAFVAALAGAGLAMDRWLDQRQTWARAIAA